METKQLTDHDFEVMISMFSVLAHAAERCALNLKASLKKSFEDTKEYERRCKADGKEVADRQLDRLIEKKLFFNESTRIGHVLKELERMENTFSKLTVNSSSTRDGQFKADFFDDIHNDANLMCRCLCYATNCKSMDEWLKVESTMKLYAKDNIVSDEVIKLFTPKN